MGIKPGPLGVGFPARARGNGMQQQTEAPPYSDDQLHGLACIRCSRSNGELVPAGHVRVENRPGQQLPWAVVACPGCLDREAA